jgi:hypothetical protein
MGGTTNATDNFTPPAAAETITLRTEEERARSEAAAQSESEHVHGPDCGHAHTEKAKEPPKGKYLDPSMIPELDLVKSFETNNPGPMWKKTAQEYLSNIAFQAASVPEGGVKLCFMNNEAYKFLLAHPSFRKRFTPASNEQQKKGIVGLFDTHVVLICDALWEQGEQLTLHKAIYFTDEVLAPVTEVVLETAEPALCQDEGCAYRGTDHVCADASQSEE